MKIRNGFVSNSSSSSFVIAYKGDLKEELDKALKLPVPENYPLKDLVIDLAAVFFKNVDETFNDVASYEKERYKTDKEVKKLFEKGFTIATGGFSDDTNSTCSYLCDQNIYYESDTLVIKQDGGY
jgi:hypothetical protein